MKWRVSDHFYYAGGFDCSPHFFTSTLEEDAEIPCSKNRG